MKKLNIQIALVLIISIFSAVISQSQELLTTAGGSYSGVNGKVSYTVGQVAFNTSTSVSEGIQQPFEIYNITSVEETKIDINMSVFPNPVKESINLRIEDYPLAGLCYQLYDVSGHLVEVKDIRATQTKINMQSNIKSVYFIKIYDQNKKKNLKSFKIIKK